MDLSSKIEVLLFWKASPISAKQLGDLLGVGEGELAIALDKLDAALKDRGLCLMRKDKEVALATSPQYSSFIQKLAKDELSKDIGRAGMEALTIVLYYGPISRREIDYIRGVNSTFTIRHLLMRGLIERVEDKKDQRVYLYKPSFDLLAYLGISNIEQLPDFKKIREEFSSFTNSEDRAKIESVEEKDHNE